MQYTCDLHQKALNLYCTETQVEIFVCFKISGRQHSEVQSEDTPALTKSWSFSYYIPDKTTETMSCQNFLKDIHQTASSDFLN